MLQERFHHAEHLNKYVFNAIAVITQIEINFENFIFDYEK